MTTTRAKQRVPTQFESSCYKLLKRVPKGRVTTYADLAAAVSADGGARAVGNAMNRNPFAPAVPCHRVVKSDGSIGGFAGGVRKKITLLSSEGVKVENGRVIDFDAVKFRFKTN